jgi:hypothetical protein
MLRREPVAALETRDPAVFQGATVTAQVPPPGRGCARWRRLLIGGATSYGRERMRERREPMAASATRAQAVFVASSATSVVGI